MNAIIGMDAIISITTLFQVTVFVLRMHFISQCFRKVTELSASHLHLIKCTFLSDPLLSTKSGLHWLLQSVYAHKSTCDECINNCLPSIYQIFATDFTECLGKFTQRNARFLNQAPLNHVIKNSALISLELI